MAKKIKQTDTSGRLPWRNTWRRHNADFLLEHDDKSWLGILRGYDKRIVEAETADRCHNTPREPHTETVLYAREVWERPKKLMPFKDLLPNGMEWAQRPDGSISIRVGADLSKPTEVVRLPTLK